MNTKHGGTLSYRYRETLARVCAVVFFVGFACKAFEPSKAHAQEPVKARALLARTPVFAGPGGKRLGYLRAGSEASVLFRTADGRYLVLELKKSDGSRVQAYGLADDFKMGDFKANDEEGPELRERRAERRREHGDEAAEANEGDDFKHWSVGFGFSGTSSSSGTQVVISGDLRYLWLKWLETLVGLDLELGSKSALGLRAGQRFYAPVSDSFRPFVHAGYRMSDVKDMQSAALEFGGGFQVAYRQGSYFELGIFYLYPKPFNSDAEGYFVFGGSSGIRF
jgi:hypothetical protein